MSLPSYQLSKNKAGAWICSGTLPSGNAFSFEAAPAGASRDRAEGTAEVRLRHKMASSKGSQARWAKWRAGNRSGARIGRPPKEAAAPAPAPSPRPADEDLKAKLLGLGADKPIGPDKVIPPDEAGSPAGAPISEDDDPELDSEGQELIASLLAKGATLGIVWLANKPLRARKPPQEGEPHEKGLEWFHDGMEHHLAKLLGRTATLGPTGKIFAGAAIICASVWMTAEPIAGAAAAAAAQTPEPAPPPAPPPVAPSATSNGTHPTPTPRLQLGTFGVEKNTVGN